jgi:hypothetical protein
MAYSTLGAFAAHRNLCAANTRLQMTLAEPLDRGPDLQVILSRGKDADHEAIIASFRLWQEFKVHCAVSING